MRHSDSDLTLTESERRALRAMFDAEGEIGVAQRLGCDRHTLVRALAGLRLRRGSALLVRLALRAGEEDRAA